MASADAATELMAAIKAGDLAKVQELTDRQPDLVHARAATGESPILLAIYHRRKPIADLLIARGAKLTIFEAAAAGQLTRVMALLHEDPSAVNGVSADGWTPLHLAAFFGHAAVVETLLAHGANVGAVSTNPTANTPLHAALAEGQTMAAGILLGHGADANATSASGWKPLHLAAASGDIHNIRLLLSTGADVNVTNDAGQTPLAMAAEKGYKEAIELLRQHGAI